MSIGIATLENNLVLPDHIHNTQDPILHSYFLDAVSKLTHMYMDMCSNMFTILYKQPTYQSTTEWKRVCILYIYIYVDL